MQPFRFGAPSRQLYGVHHPPMGSQPRSTAVLICNPLGQEAVRTHRMFRVLAERLARAGRHVLRFDYYGTGEAAGDDEQGDLLGWRQDLCTAHAELLQRSGCTASVWVGARLGATLALMAAPDAPRPPTALVLWEPVVSGQHYLDHLAQHHRQALAESYSIVPPVLLQVETHDEALGFGLGAALRQQLRAADLRRMPLPRSSRVTLVAPPGDAHADDLAAALREQGNVPEVVAFTHQFDWTSEEAINTALVPSEAVQLLASHIETAP